MSQSRKVMTGAFAAALLAALAWALWPDPVAVDLAPVTRGPMQVTVTAEGITRVREPYAITAPISGVTTRSPVQVGDWVEQGQTVVAVIQPTDPALMDARSRAEAEAAVAEAEAAVQLGEANLQRAQTTVDHARSELERGRNLARAGTIPMRMLEDFEQAATLAAQSLAAARAELDLRLATLARAQAQLIGPGSTALAERAVENCCVQIVAPLTGTVLDVADRNARQVAAGSPLLTIGDVQDLEIEIDLLSADAVRVSPGAMATVERWGGPGVLDARVRRIEPAAFTRISALGIEEQRVRLQLDLLTQPQDRPGLGDRFRVFVRVVVWQGDDLLQVPQSALFRSDGDWAVFRNVDGRAVLTPVTLGRQSQDRTEVVTGLNEGDGVVLYPSHDLSDGGRIVARTR